MARNKNLHTYDIASVFREYDKYLLDELDKKDNELKAKIEELKQRKEDLSSGLSEEDIARSIDISDIQSEINTAEQELNSLVSPVTLDSFKEFLAKNKLSTIYAEELFGFYGRPNEFKASAIEEFKTRRKQPKLRFFLKKFVAPAIVTTAAIGAVVGLIALSGLTAGASWGLLPVFSSIGKTAIAAASVGATVGLVATPAIIATKNKAVKKYYKYTAGSAHENLVEFSNGMEVKDLYITQLMNKVEKTSNKMLDSNRFSRFFMQMINKNRVKHIANYTKDLMKTYKTIENDDAIHPNLKAKKLNNLHTLLKQVDTFIQNDVERTKTTAMLTAKTNKKEKLRKPMVENIDIYADLQMHIKKEYPQEDEKPEKYSIFSRKYLHNQHVESRKILEGDRIIPKLVSRWRSVENRTFNFESETDYDTTYELQQEAF